MRKSVMFAALPLALATTSLSAQELVFKCDSVSETYGTETTTIKIDATAKTVNQSEGTKGFVAGKSVTVTGDTAEWTLPVKVPILGTLDYKNKLDMKKLEGTWKDTSGYDDGTYKNCRREDASPPPASPPPSPPPPSP